MILRYNPLQVFSLSKTPAGLYARRKWLGEENSGKWRLDFQNTVNRLLDGQSHDGSWGRSPLTTIQRLFGLHLTVRNRTEPVSKALNRLIDQMNEVFPRRLIPLEGHRKSEKLKGLPFGPGCSGFFLYGATLFLSTIFGLHEHKSVVSAYERLAVMGSENNGRWCGWSCSNNILRAFVVHPEFSRSRVVRQAVEALSRVQLKSGEWGHGIPFYQTVNALAHLDLPGVETRLEAAFNRLRNTQRKDGAWGRGEKEWNTFLVVHALKNKGVWKPENHVGQ